MSKINPNLLFDDDDAYEARRMSRELLITPKRGRRSERISQSVADQQDHGESMRFSYHASRHEREWIVNSLGNFYDLHWFSDVLRLVQGGKEASVYLCRADETVTAKYLAAKIYRPRKFRNLKNDHLYREGRGELGADGLALLNGGMQHAMRKRTAYGLELLHASWIAHEVKTLNLLHDAGADVPRVYASGDNAILMEYIGDEGMAAPVLNSLDLEIREASLLFERLLWNIELMLANQRVHGDLSAFNILYWQGNALGASPDWTPIPRQVERGDHDAVVWLTHHDLTFPGYESGRTALREVPGVDLVVNGHIHLPKVPQQVGQTLWLNAGSLVRISRSLRARDMHPVVTIWTPLPPSLEAVEVPHAPFDEVFPPLDTAGEDLPGWVDQSMFIKGLENLAMRRTSEGSGCGRFSKPIWTLKVLLTALSGALRGGYEPWQRR